MLQCTPRVAREMVFIPFHYHECVNRLSLGLLDPHSRQPAYKQCAVRIEAVDDQTAALYFMRRIYRIPARPYWNHWQVLTAFYGNMLALGPLVHRADAGRGRYRPGPPLGGDRVHQPRPHAPGRRAARLSLAQEFQRKERREKSICSIIVISTEGRYFLNFKDSFKARISHRARTDNQSDFS
jgi:hypothetical protein